MRQSDIQRAGAGLLVLALLLTASVAQAAQTVTLYVTDAQGTVVAQMTPQGPGQPDHVTYTAAYRPYGQQVLGMPQGGPGYTGHVNDADSGLVYMQQRYYDPESQRFASVDPVVPAPGNVFNFNRYDYANNNPIVNIDPLGTQTQYISPGNSEEERERAREERDRQGNAGGNSNRCEVAARNEYRALNGGIRHKQGQALKQAGKYFVEQGAILYGGGVFEKFLGRIAEVLGFAAREGRWTFWAGKSESKWMGQLERRGWTVDQISEAIRSGKRYPAENLVNPGNPATRYVNSQTGRSVVIDDVTREVIHVGGDGFRYGK